MWTTVYKTRNRLTAKEVFEVLSAAGLTPCYPFDPDRYTGSALWLRYFAEIAVPDEQAEQAVLELKDWETNRPRVNPETRRFVRRQFFGGLLIVGLVLVVTPIFSPTLSDLVRGSLGIVGFVLLGILNYRKLSQVLKK